MAIKIGNKDVANIFIGSTPVKSVYKGNTKIWASEGWHAIFDTETTWSGNTTSTTVIASTTNESKKFRITYKAIGYYVTVYQHTSKNSNTEYTDTFEISDTGTIALIQTGYSDFQSDAKSKVELLYNVSTKEFSIKLTKRGNQSNGSLTIYKIEQFY